MVTPNGTVIDTPAVVPSGILGTGEGPPIDKDQQANANPAGLAVSTNRGANWALVRPLGITWNPTDHAEYVDPATGRFFFEDYGPIPLAPSLGVAQEGPAHIMWTDDFVHWHHVALVGFVLPENPRFTSAPAPAGQPRPHAYPDVVYFCANTNVGFTTPAILERICYRSLDGGSSWTRTSVMLRGLLPVHAQCGLRGEQFSAIDGYYPSAMADGSLYTLFSCGGATYLARSVDEAHSFPIVRLLPGLPTDSITTIGSGPQLRIDRAGDFYVVYPQKSGSKISGLILITSRDRGATWSRPALMTPPAVTGILRWSVTTGATGVIGAAYVGQRAGQTTWDAYVTYTADAFDASPLLWTGIANTAPIMFADHVAGAGYIRGVGQIDVPFPFPLGIQPLASGVLSAGNDFLGVAIGPDGTVWGSFNADCGPTPKSTGCVADGDQTRGLVARLTPQ